MTRSFLSPLVHDLLYLESCEVNFDVAEDADSIRTALVDCPWVVVRRALVTCRTVPIGIRGAERWQRWSGSVRPEQIVAIATPMQLRSDLIARDRVSLPGMSSLVFLETEFSSLFLEWGPGGSVAYELASGRHVVRTTSDLDLVIRAPKRFDRMFAKDLLTVLLAAPTKVDCRIETPLGGFLLEEYAHSQGARLLVRTPAGPILSDDPWTASSARVI